MLTNEIEVPMIQQHVLKVHINCYGCTQKVKRKLNRIKGVCNVNIDVEQQKVTVFGNIEASTLLEKLVKIKKYAEIWSPKYDPNQNQEEYEDTIDDDNVRDQYWTREGHPNQFTGMRRLISEEEEMGYINMVNEGDYSPSWDDISVPSYGYGGLPEYRYGRPSSVKMNNMHDIDMNTVMNRNMYEMRNHTTFPIVPPYLHNFYNISPLPHPNY